MGVSSQPLVAAPRDVLWVCWARALICVSVRCYICVFVAAVQKCIDKHVKNCVCVCIRVCVCALPILAHATL